MTKARQMRQGDVLVTEAVERTPIAGETERPREAGRVVLAHGELTGHAHAIAEEAAVLLAVVGQPQLGRRLRADAEVTLRHEEHGPITIARGSYEVVIQREYIEGAIRNVAD